MSDLTKGRLKIAVYSGSFNPIHRGHIAILRYLVEKMDFDKVYLIVSPKNPLKDSISESSGKKRYDDVVSVIKGLDLPKVEVDDIELNMPSPHYTIRTLDALRKRDPDCDFSLVIGADNLYQIDRWKDYGRILKDYGVVVFPRQGYPMEAEKSRLEAIDADFKILLTDMPRVDISSTQIREAKANGSTMTGDCSEI